MKTYEKPTLTLLIVSANDTLCSGCDKKTRFDPVFNQFDDNGNGIFDPGDHAFSSAEECDDVYDYIGYCKFTGADGMQLFTS